MHHRWISLAIVLACASWSRPCAAEVPSLIPAPVSVKLSTGSFQLTADTQVVAQGAAAAEAKKFIDAIAPATGFRLQLIEQEPVDATIVVFALDESAPETLGREGYAIKSTPTRIDVRATAPAGLFYAAQTLRQLLPPEIFSTRLVEGVLWTMPLIEITDYPRFAWRGLLIDPARHFIPVADVKHFLDAMALHKLNHLQMHLTDNEGWRIEIKKYPQLATIGSQMDWTLRYKNDGGPRHFGFYTQDDIRRLVRYATERHITIVPEIEMPYHAGAAIVAFPALGVNMNHLAQLPITDRWQAREGDWRPNSGLIGPRPDTVTFLQDVLSEVMQLFPSRFIHIGGDEANTKVWEDDPEMQRLMQELGCQDAHQLHSWFIRQMDMFLTRAERRMIGWDEILQGGLAPGATVMSWRGTAGGVAAAQSGHAVVMAPTSHTYFDYRQHADELGLGRSVLTLERVYSFEPVPESLTKDQAQHILGGQGQLWGELIADRQRRDFMAWPRGCALSEVLWTPSEERDLDDFLDRIAAHIKRLDAARIGYRPLDAEATDKKGDSD